MELYDTKFNPNPEKYKRVIIDSFMSTNPHYNNFYVDSNYEGDAIIAPPKHIDRAIRSGERLLRDVEIVSIEDPDPNQYPDHIANRIRGDVPKLFQYINEMNNFDPRCYKTANTINHSVTYYEGDFQEYINDINLLFAEPFTLDQIQKMGEDIVNLDQLGTNNFPGYKRLISTGETLESTFDCVTVKYGGSSFEPTQSNPHGRLSINTLYVHMKDKVNSNVVEWVEEKYLQDSDSVLRSERWTAADEFSIEKDIQNSTANSPYIRLWWD